MKFLLIFSIVFLNAVGLVYGQQRNENAPPYSQRDALARQNQEMRDTNRVGYSGPRREEVRYYGNLSAIMAEQIARNSIIPLYRDLTEEEAELLAVNPEDAAKYADFLRKSDTGIVKLAPDYGCAENPTIVVASPECLKYSMPGGGASYSFRVNNYRLRRLADLTYSKDSFQTTGVNLHGLLVNIGDVPLEQLSLTSRGIKFLRGFVPATDYPMAEKIEKQIAAGFSDDGYAYRRGLAAQENSTYLLRSIAYRGVSYRSVQGLTYDELDFDRRRDVIIAFRVVRRDADGSVTILWRELEDKRSPFLKKKKNKIKEDKFIASSRYSRAGDDQTGTK